METAHHRDAYRDNAICPMEQTRPSLLHGIDDKPACFEYRLLQLLSFPIDGTFSPTQGRDKAERYINMYIHVDTPEPLIAQNREIWISAHAVKRAREREIAFPDQVYNALRTGRIERFGKNGIKFIKKTREGSIVCVGEDTGYTIIIKTIERGN